MLREFSKELEEDRTFEIGGEVFKFRLFHWTETVEMLDSKVDEGLVINEDGSYSFKMDIDWTIKQILTFLDGPEDVKRFKARLAKKTDPLPHIHLIELYKFLRLKVQALPTPPPSSGLSADGGGSNGAESSAASPSTAATSTT
jgi:hypothetical protein